MRRRVYVDMDGVIADFMRGMIRDYHSLPKEYKLVAGAFRNLPLMPRAAYLLQRLEELGLEVWIATKIPTHNPLAATEKLLWIQDRFPHLLNRVIITPDKGTLGNENDILIDDRPHKAHCDQFVGSFIHAKGDVDDIIQQVEALL